MRDVLDSSRLALGPYMKAFEERMAEACGTRHAVAVSSGTAALHLIAAALGLGPGDEVITTPFSFVASANVLLYVGAHPVFVDVEHDTFNIDVQQIEEAVTHRTRAILAVDVFGRPANWPALTTLAERHGLMLIDDACEALGAVIGGRIIGSWGQATAFGFYPNKQITTGEGGCITTDSDDIATLCRSLRNQGRVSSDQMTHVRLGYNYRMSELCAALGLAQVERLDELLAARERVAVSYDEYLCDLQDEVVLPERTGIGAAGRSWFVYVVLLRDHHTSYHRDQLLNFLQDRGVGCAPYLPAIHLQPYYRQRFHFGPGDYPVCEHVADRTVALPFHSRLADDDIRYVTDVLSEGLRELRQSAAVCISD